MRRSLEALSDAWSPSRQVETAVFWSALLLMVTATLFGGASQTNALCLMAVELASLPLLYVSFYVTLSGGAPRGLVVPLIVLAGLVAVPVLQLLPLPAQVWTALPGRGVEARVLDTVGLGRPALPYSLTPQQTWRAALGLAAPVAMFLGALLLSDRQRRVMGGLWLFLAVVSLSLGVLQVMGGKSSPLYFYQITNLGSPVGLFSNRNHHASFLLCLIPMAAVFAARFRGFSDDWRVLPPVLAMLYVFVAIMGVAAIHSRAGVALVVIALVGAVALIATSGGSKRVNWRAVAVAAGAGALAIGAVLMFGLTPLIHRFDQTQELRFQGWPIVLKAARTFLPLGSGVGSFDTIYRSVEPLKDVSVVYFNHAHDDYLELWLETGVAGAVLLAIFAGWLAVRSYRVWTTRGQGRDFAAACTLLIGLLLAHSLVDYPLRTESLAVLFAFACGCVATYSPERRDASDRRGRRSASGSTRSGAPARSDVAAPEPVRYGEAGSPAAAGERLR